MGQGQGGCQVTSSGGGISIPHPSSGEWCRGNENPCDKARSRIKGSESRLLGILLVSG